MYPDTPEVSSRAGAGEVTGIEDDAVVATEDAAGADGDADCVTGVVGSAGPAEADSVAFGFVTIMTINFFSSMPWLLKTLPSSNIFPKRKGLKSQKRKSLYFIKKNACIDELLAYCWVFCSFFFLNLFL